MDQHSVKEGAIFWNVEFEIDIAFSCFSGTIRLAVAGIMFDVAQMSRDLYLKQTYLQLSRFELNRSIFDRRLVSYELFTVLMNDSSVGPYDSKGFPYTCWRRLRDTRVMGDNPFDLQDLYGWEAVGEYYSESHQGQFVYVFEK